MGPTGKSLLELAFEGDRPDGPSWPELPPVCVVTGDTSNVTFRKVKFSWFSRWVLLLALVPTGSVFLAGIAALFLRKKASGELPFSDRGWRQWRMAKMVTPISVFLALGTLSVAMGASSSDPSSELGLAWVAIAAGIPLALYLAFQRNRMVRPVRITRDEIALEIPSEEAARAVLDHLHPGTALQTGPLFAAAR
ncbi:MAG TPA: hypothetical protein VIG99_11900 [Myxococcaceae bacterium]